MLNTSRTEHLYLLVSSEKWRNHCAALSDTLGFRLSIYTEDGHELFTTESPNPLCRKVMACPEFQSQCEQYCTSTMQGVLQNRRPVVYKCRASIMSFAFPLAYIGEKAIMLGQGSFSDYEDFRSFLNVLDSCGMDQLSITTPLQFTNEQYAWKVCRLVDTAVHELLSNEEESFALQQKIDSLKKVMGKWYVTGTEEPETYYEHMMSNLLILLDIQHIAIFSTNKRNGIYASLYSLRKDGEAVEPYTISKNDIIVQELLRGKPYVSYLDPLLANRGDFLREIPVFYFFPIVISNKLAGILGIFGNVLKEGDVNIITAFCRQTALSIENQRLHKDLSKKFNRFAALSELTGDIAAIQNYESLIGAILDKSAALLRAEQGSLMVLDHETDALLLAAKKDITDSIQETVRVQKGEGIAGKVAELGEPVLVENVEDDPRFRQKNRIRYKTPSFISVPLKTGGRTIAVLNLSDKASGDVFTADDLKLIESFANHAAVALDRKVLFNQSERLKKLSITDPLTGLLNRRYLQERLEEELSRTGRHGRNLSIMMLDIDGFKNYNDTFGHTIGDSALKMIVETILHSIRTMDIAARFGGDEFIIILPETGESMALNIAQRLRNDVAAMTLPTPNRDGSDLCTVTVSIGIACYPEHGGTVEVLLENVDKALYRAKQRGRNRVEVFS